MNKHIGLPATTNAENLTFVYDTSLYQFGSFLPPTEEHTKHVVSNLIAVTYNRCTTDNEDNGGLFSVAFSGKMSFIHLSLNEVGCHHQSEKTCRFKLFLRNRMKPYSSFASSLQWTRFREDLLICSFSAFVTSHHQNNLQRPGCHATSQEQNSCWAQNFWYVWLLISVQRAFSVVCSHAFTDCKPTVTPPPVSNHGTEQETDEHSPNIGEFDHVMPGVGLGAIESTFKCSKITQRNGGLLSSEKELQSVARRTFL